MAQESRLWNMRLPEETKRLWTEAAEAEGVSLSEYVRTVVTADATGLLETGREEEMDVETAENTDTFEETSAGAAGTVELAAVAEDAVAEEEVDTAGEPWGGVLGTIGSPTEDGRYLVPGEISNRDLPVELHMQPKLAEGHDGADPVGTITSIEYIPFSEFEGKEDFYTPSQIAAMPEHAVVIFGGGELNGPYADEARRRIKNGADVSLDGLHYNGSLYDASTFKELTEDDLPDDEPGAVFQGMMEGAYLQGVVGEIGGATIVAIGAYKEARLIVTASGSLTLLSTEKQEGDPEEENKQRFLALVAAAGPVKPPRDWFEDPQLRELTPLQITKEGQVYGHLADWNGCHTGFQGVCVPPFQSFSNYAYFNVGEIETAEGDLVPCGKLMFAMDGAGHAPTDPQLTYIDIQRYYDDATKVGAFVRAGSDRFGTWLAGALRPGLSEIEIQHLRTHPPSGDWRPIRGGDSDLVASFSVPVPGFPIPRGEALVASAGGEIIAIISAPLVVSERGMARHRLERLREAMGLVDVEKTKADLRREAMERVAVEQETDFTGPWDDGPELAEITAEQRRKWAKSGAAMRDGSFPITKCTGDGPSAVNARRAIGRAPEAKRNAVRAHIAKRERALGCSNED
jgi:uncharacterized protein (DUF1778 family)